MGYCPPASTREMAAILGISRNTVILVCQQLVDGGCILTCGRSDYVVSTDDLRLQKSMLSMIADAADAIDDSLWTLRLRRRFSR